MSQDQSATRGPATTPHVTRSSGPPSVLGRLARSAALGAAIGLVWGVLARIWMRLISTEPEFTWTGTLLIIGFATWLAMAISVVHATRKAGRHRWLAILVIPGLGLFLAQGSTLFPAFVIGSALWNRAASKSVRLIIAGIGLAAVAGPTYFVWESGKAELTGVQSSLLLIGFGLMSLSLSYAASYLWRPVPSPSPIPPSTRLETK